MDRFGFGHGPLQSATRSFKLSLGTILIIADIMKIYTIDYLKSLRDSPLAVKPPGLLPTEQWMGYAISFEKIRIYKLTDFTDWPENLLVITLNQ